MPNRETFPVLGLPVDAMTLSSAADWVLEQAAGTTPVTAHFVNAHCINVVAEDRSYRQALLAADRVLPDGSGIRMACRMLGHAAPDNVNGTDLLPLMCERLAAAGVSIYLLGGGPGVAAVMAENLIARWPGLRVAGSRDGFFSEDKTEAVIDEINASGAAVLLVAMGVPRQELWIARHRALLAPRVCMGVGGLFDFFSGRIPRAPRVLRGLGLEWTWRLAQEPRRMWRRYLVGNPAFLLRVGARRLHDMAAEARGEHLLSRWSVRGARLRVLAGYHARRHTWAAMTVLAEAAKRGLDILAAGTALTLLTPVWLAVAAAIKLDSPGPVLFRQQRVGLHGKQFGLWKFRSMYIDAEARKAALMAQNEMQGGVIFKMRNDPRITRVGRFLRRASIDEMPQLWNVLRGDMTLVGPRPPLPSEVAEYSLHDRRRLDGVPGLTCTWQVSGRSDIPFARQVEMDIDYNDGRTLRRDLVLLLRTVPAVVTGRGAR
jgi:exopolysaccharide biosynthesis WecB/TagA/CpsF family protein